MNTDIKDYQQKVADILARDYFTREEGYTLRTDTVRKNNGVSLHAICVLDNNSNISPAFYAEDYAQNGFEPEAAAHSIYNNYQRQRKEQHQLASMDFNRLRDFNAIKDLICFKVINRQKNAGMIGDYPVININDDLMLAFYLQINKGATCLIQNQMCAFWNLDRPAETLFEYARQNTERLHPVQFQSMFEVMREMMPDEMCDDFEARAEIPMYVLTNRDKINGASVMFYRNGTLLDDYVKQFQSTSKNVEGIYILPSSMHEVLLIPDNKALSIDENALVSMVREVNRTQVAESEVLSDNIFYYRTGEPIKQLTYSAKQIVR